MKRYIFNVLLAIDQLFNALLIGYADESFSARSYRLRKYFFWYWTMVLIDRIFFWSKNHCMKSFAAEKYQKHLPAEYRE